MAMWERHDTQKLCPKGPSFSSSLLDAIYRSIDDKDQQKPQEFTIHRHVEEDIESLRRAIVIEKWMESHTTGASRSTPRHGHFPSNSGSSTDSSVFSSSETESSSPKSSLKQQKSAQTPPAAVAKTKTRAQKIYGDLKKVKEPISPGGKIANFLNSIFSPRNLKTTSQQWVDEWSSMRKSRSMKDTTTTCSLASRSCLSKNASSRSRGSKSKRSVRFCPVSTVIVDNDEFTRPAVGNQFIKKNIDSFRVFEAKNVRKYEVRDCCKRNINDHDLDDVSCASSDLFELENIGRLEIGLYEEDLPVYETTSLQINQRLPI